MIAAAVQHFHICCAHATSPLDDDSFKIIREGIDSSAKKAERRRGQGTGVNTIDMALCIFIKDLLQLITYLFSLLLCFCDGIVNRFDICSMFVELTRNILCNQYNCYGC